MSTSTMLLSKEAIQKLFNPTWNLGDVFFTAGVRDLFKREDADIRSFWPWLDAHLRGDYYEVDEPVGAIIQRARDEGKFFSSFWRHEGKVIRIATNQTRCVTTAYLVGED